MNKFEELLVKRGLYDKINISIDDLDEMENLLSNYSRYTIDCFCVKCNEKRIFRFEDKQIFEESGFVRIIDTDGKIARRPKKEAVFQGYLNKRYSISFSCTRDQNHSLLFDLLVTDNEIIKIGQYPSFADISIENKSKYKSVLGDKYHEYNKSLGLFSHGVGIGSFVYLRRIIESLVFDKFEEVSGIIGVEKEIFIQSDFKNKITILEDFLPKLLVDNKNLYGIVSKGIHELGEKECIDMYPLIKTGIELILDDIIAERQRKEKEKEFKKFIADKTGEFKNRANE